MKKALEICPTTTFGRVKEEALIVDVREPNEIRELALDVPNILNIPISEFEARFREISKDSEIIMVSLSGNRSLRATYFLMNNNYLTVSNMSGGIIKWVGKGGPTIGDRNTALENIRGADYCVSATGTRGEACC